MPEILGGPERGVEKLERYREQQTVTPELEQKIQDKVAQHEVYPDIVFCPNQKCGQPIKLQIKEDYICLYCIVCGFEKVLLKK